MKIKYLFILIITGHICFAQNTVGIISNTSHSFDGYTLFAPSGSTSTYLINNCGELVHQWESQYRPGAVAYLMEDGSILRAAQLNNDQILAGGGGGRIEKISWEGELLWSFDYNNNLVRQHHDFEVLPNGNILILAWERKTPEQAIAKGRDPDLLSNEGLLSEHIIEIRPVGIDEAEVVWEWHIWDHMIQEEDNSLDNYAIISDNPDKFNINNIHIDGNPLNEDFIHFNSIDYHSELDQIMLSSRACSEIYIIDHSTTTEEASGSTGGLRGKGGGFLYRYGNQQVYNRGTSEDQKLWGQHDAHWIPQGIPNAGKILIFNNGTGRPGIDYSQIDMIVPPINNEGSYDLYLDGSYGPDELYFSYDQGTEMSEKRISGSQALENGNILICLGTSGRFIEIDAFKNIVWEYINPDRNGTIVDQGTPSIISNDVFRAYRYGPDYPAFNDTNLTPGPPLESGSFYNCNLYPLASNTQDLNNNLLSINVYPNPVVDILNIEGSSPLGLVEVYNMSGQCVFSKFVDIRKVSIDLGFWGMGVYLLTLPTHKQLITIY